MPLLLLNGNWVCGSLQVLSKRDGRTGGSQSPREQVWPVCRIINPLMKAIILAAGKGTRLNGVELKPKCLFEVGGETLLARQIAALRELHVDDIVIVLGFEAERIRRLYEHTASFVINSRFEETSSMYSLWLAREHLLDGFVVLNCDVLFHPQLLARLLSSPFEDALLIDLVDKNNNHLGDEG